MRKFSQSLILTSFLTLLIFFSFLFSQEKPVEEEKQQFEEKNFKSYFIASEVFLGISTYSWLLPASLALNDRVTVAIGLWTPAISFFLSSRVHYVKSSGTPLQSLFGGIGGTLRGFIISTTSKNNLNPFVLPLFLSLIENIGGFYLSEKLKFGTEDTWRFFNLNILGFYHAAMLQILNEGKLENYKYLYSALSALEGYGGSILLSKEKDISFGDAFCELEYARIGITTPLAFLGGMELLTNKDFFNKNSVAISSLIGSSLGYYFGYKMSKKRDLSFGEALIVLFAPRIIEGMIFGTAILLSEDLEKTFGISLIAVSIADPIGTYLIDKKLSK